MLLSLVYLTYSLPRGPLLVAFGPTARFELRYALPPQLHVLEIEVPSVLSTILCVMVALWAADLNPRAMLEVIVAAVARVLAARISARASLVAQAAITSQQDGT